MLEGLDRGSQKDRRLLFREPLAWCRFTSHLGNALSSLWHSCSPWALQQSLKSYPTTSRLLLCLDFWGPEIGSGKSLRKRKQGRTNCMPASQLAIGIPHFGTHPQGGPRDGWHAIPVLQLHLLIISHCSGAPHHTQGQLVLRLVICTAGPALARCRHEPPPQSSWTTLEA